MKKFNTKWLCGIGAMFILCVVLAGCSESSTTSTSSVGSTSTGSSEQKSEKTEYNVGNVIAFDGKEITVTKVEKNYNTGNEYSVPKSNNQFVKLSIKIENKSNSNISANTFDFKIQDSNGAIDDVDSSTYSLDDQFESAELIPGGTRAGSVIFEVPKNDSGLKFIYQPSFWSNKKIEVKL